MINKQMREGCSLPQQAAGKSFTQSARNFYNPTNYKKVLDFSHFDASLSEAGLAVEYAKMGLQVFPCDKTKAPIVDRSLGFVHGVKDATSDTRIIAKTWFRYPNAAIACALPRGIIVFDCDVKKDTTKRPVLKDGSPDRIGLRSFQSLIMDLKITGKSLYTLSVRTQSGGTHFYFKMPDGIPSFNHTSALPGLDVKGFGGYTILPNSAGEYGQYHFLNLSEIRELPDPLLTWIMQFRGKPENAKPVSLPTGVARIDREKIIKILEPYWAKGDGRRNDFTLAIAGFIARSGGAEEDAVYIINELAKRTLKGSNHVPGARYSFHRNGKIKGLTALKQLMEELGND